MGFRLNICLALIMFFLSVFLGGCVSYQIIQSVEGDEVVPSDDKLLVDKSTLGEVLVVLGAPDKLAKLEGKDLLVYERAFLYRNRIKVGIPFSSFLRAGLDISAYGTLVRYDTLALFFTPDGILRIKVYEKGSSHPYLRTLFSDK